MRRSLVILLTAVVAMLASAGAAQAVVVDMGGAGQFGVALVPGTGAFLATAGASVVSSSAVCTDPFLASDLGGPALPANGLCSRGGGVLHSNETFDLTWDPLRRDWATTRNYVETFLQNVANSSGNLNSPFAVTSQYQDSGGRAGNASLYGGGCIDYGTTGGVSCQFGKTDGSGPGQSYPANGCPVIGFNQFAQVLSGVASEPPNDVCLTDAQLKAELATMITEEGLVGRIQPGYSPLLVLMTPPGVETCLDAAGKLCSANASYAPPLPLVGTSASGGNVPAGTYQVVETYVTATGETIPSAPQTVTTTGTASTISILSPPQANGATGWYAYLTQAGGSTFTRQPTGGPIAIGNDLTLSGQPSQNGPIPPPDTTPAFCSYHSQVTVGGVVFSYVVQPWTALSGLNGCDEPNAPQIPEFPTAQVLSTDIGARLVSPLSQGEIATIVNPALNGWVAQNGAEVNDNGCIPLAHQLDKVTVGATSYLLQREFNNGGVIESDPNAQACTPLVNLGPTFVNPGSVNASDVVQFNGSTTVSSLVVPSAGYAWSFGDGKTAVGPSVTHSFDKTGTYTVKLTVTDRGGNTASFAQTIDVKGPKGTPPSSTGIGAGLKASLQLLPQNLRGILRRGLAVMVRSNQAADGIASISIPVSSARHAHIGGRGPAVVVARGTVSGLVSGTMMLHLHIDPRVAHKLSKLRHVTLTVRLIVLGAGHHSVAIDAAGHY
ncbi:MAG: PKD domain-containing protein [Solirubrobacteraceae bacterium]